MVGSRIAMLGAAVAVAVPVTPAQAQSKSAQAEALFREGRELMAAGRTAEACRAFDASNELESALTTLLNIGACREKNGQLATAFGAYAAAARLATSATGPNAPELVRIADEHVARIESRVSKLTIRVPKAHRVVGLEVTRETEPVTARMWNLPLAVDGGSHKITARAPGYVEWSTTVEIEAEQDNESITVPALIEDPDAETSVDDTEGSRVPVAPIVLGVVALGSFAGAIGVGLSAYATYDDADIEADWDKQDKLWHSANRQLYVAQALAAVGIGCTAAALWLYLRGDRASSTSARLQLQPTVSDHGVAFAISGSY